MVAPRRRHARSRYPPAAPVSPMLLMRNQRENAVCAQRDSDREAHHAHDSEQSSGSERRRHRRALFQGRASRAKA